MLQFQSKKMFYILMSKCATSAYLRALKAEIICLNMVLLAYSHSFPLYTILKRSPLSANSSTTAGCFVTPFPSQTLAQGKHSIIFMMLGELRKERMLVQKLQQNIALGFGRYVFIMQFLDYFSARNTLPCPPSPAKQSSLQFSMYIYDSI